MRFFVITCLNVYNLQSKTTLLLPVWHRHAKRLDILGREYITSGKHKARRPDPALHLVLSGLAPCFYPMAVPSSLPLVKEQLHLCSPKITFSTLKATERLVWPLVKMSLTPLEYMIWTWTCDEKQRKKNVDRIQWTLLVTNTICFPILISSQQNLSFLSQAPSPYTARCLRKCKPSAQILKWF